MKKLFSTLLAATMVAGMSVTSFAYVDATGAATATGVTPSNTDYTLQNKAFRDGVKIEEGDLVEGGDEIYYPILCVDEDDDGKFKYANRASEVEDLKVRIDDVYGGKYIKSAKIVREELPVVPGTAVGSPNSIQATATNDGKNAEAGTYTVTISKAATAIGNVTVAGITVDIKTKDNANAQAKEIADAINDDTKSDFKASYNNAVVTLTEKPGKEGSTSLPTTGTENGFAATVDNTKTGVAEKAATYTFDLTAIKVGNKVTVTNAGTIDEFAYVSPADFKTKVEAGGKYTVTITDQSAKLDAVDPGAKTPVKLSHKTPGTPDSDRKIYCVEVALQDYFGTSDKEVDFEISLRTRGVEYDSDDQGGDAPMSFTLGEESDKLKTTDSIVKKFRNGDLTLRIDEDTTSVRLDEMDDGDDIEHIYLEGEEAPFTFDAKASGQDDLFLKVDEKANKKVVISNQDAKMTFVNFPGEPEFDFTGTLQITVEDPDVKYYFYEIVDDKPVETKATYNSDDECFELRTRTLGSYVISDKPLDTADVKDDEDKADKPVDDKETVTPVNPTNPGGNNKIVGTGAIA